VAQESPEGSPGRAAEVRAASAARFAEPREKVDQLISTREGHLFARAGSQPVDQSMAQRVHQPTGHPGARHPKKDESPGANR
jgi:hypothetical protein